MLTPNDERCSRVRLLALGFAAAAIIMTLRAASSCDSSTHTSTSGLFLRATDPNAHTPTATGGHAAGGEHPPAYRVSSSADTQPALEFIEVGTSNFDTLIQHAHGTGRINATGASVDAMRVYLNQLPDLPGVARLNYAVVGYQPHPETLPVHFISSDDIVKHNMPAWLRGCNRVGEPHKTAMEYLKSIQRTDLMQHSSVPVISIGELLMQVGGCRVGTLKLDVEGLDPDLLVGYVGFLWLHPECRADAVMFEFNELSTQTAQNAALAALSTVGYFHRQGTPTESVLKYSPHLDVRRWATTAAVAMDAAGSRAHQLASLFTAESLRDILAAGV